MRILKKKYYTLLWKDFGGIIKVYGADVLPHVAASATTGISENRPTSTGSQFD
jgi:hypothetical protein